MPIPEDLTLNGWLELREAVAKIIVQDPSNNYSRIVGPQDLQAAENLINAGVINVSAVLPSVQE